MTPRDALVAAANALAKGDAEGALCALRSVDLAGEEPDARELATLLLAEAGDDAGARVMAGTLGDGPTASAVRAALAAGPPDDPADVDGGEDDEPPDARPVAAAHGEEAVALFSRFFGGRRDLYARQWFDERRGRGGYHPVEQPLTSAVVAAHLAGRVTVGQYVLHPDARCSFAVIDLDLSASAMAELRSTEGRALSALGHAPLRAFSARVLDAGPR